MLGLAAMVVGGCAWSAGPAVKVSISANARSIGMGRPVAINATARLANGKPAVGWQMLSYVNGVRWGAQETSDAQGKARFIFPLPRPETVKIVVVAETPPPAADDYWIWPKSEQGKPGTVYMQQTFDLPNGAKGATLWLACDDRATLYLNGTKVGSKGGWHDMAPITLGAGVFRRGRNVLSAETFNGAGPAGLLVRMIVNTAAGKKTVLTNDQWLGWVKKPEGWPAQVATGGEKVGTYGSSVTGNVRPDKWPTLGPDDLRTGTPLEKGAKVSNTLAVRVLKRALQRPPRDPKHLLCVQWEEWFTPLNNGWQTAEGVPLMGYYSSYLRDVARQHLIWFIESGVDCILVDHSNHIWQSSSWNPGPGSKQLLDTSALMMDEMAEMRREGYAVPKITFLGGISYARPNGPKAVDGELNYVWNHYVTPAKYKGLWQMWDGKPLMEILDCGATYYKEKIKLDPRFTIRYVGAQQDVTGTNKYGFWSWMDAFHPAPTPMPNGAPGIEAETVCTGSFEGGGWLAKTARGHRNGATIIEDFNVALRDKPAFLHLHQFNEFAGQAEGAGSGPNHNGYVDTYSADLCDDFEPTSMTTPAYRSDGGWGYYYLNLIRALVDLYKQPTPRTTVVAISDPVPAKPGHNIAPKVKAGPLAVKWEYAGVRPMAWTVTLDGKVLKYKVVGDGTTIDLSGVKPGRHMLRVTAVGSIAHYRLAWDTDSLPLPKPEEAYGEVPLRVVAAG